MAVSDSLEPVTELVSQEVLSDTGLGALWSFTNDWASGSNPISLALDQ